MTKNSKQSSAGMASQAAKVLASSNSSGVAKSLAASVLSQAGTFKQTRSALESVATKVLHSQKYSDNTKSLAASVLSQANKER